MQSSFPAAEPSQGVSVEALLRDEAIRETFRLVSGTRGVDRVIGHPRIQKSGLALAGHLRGVVPSRVQILGETELTYLETLSPALGAERLDGFFALGLSLVVITRGVEVPRAILTVAEAHSVPVIVSHERSSQTIHRMHRAFDRIFAPRTEIHGVLMDVHGVGLLLVGPSGIGKSECALFLLERGHRLVADDRVRVERAEGGQLLGKAPELLREHLEIRGLGIVNVRKLFGIPAFRARKRVDLVVELRPEGEGRPMDRLGLDDRTTLLLSQEVPLVEIPVQPGRNMAVILEVAARAFLARLAGHHPARDFVARLSPVPVDLEEDQG